MRPPKRGEIMGGNNIGQKPVPRIRGEYSEGNFTINRGCRARTRLDAYSQRHRYRCPRAHTCSSDRRAPENTPGQMG